MSRLSRHCRRPSAHAITISVAAAACDPPAGEGKREASAEQDSAVILRDSADIQIVENVTPKWDSAEFWSVEPEPEFTIGGYGGTSDPRNASHLVWDIVAAAVLSDGRVVMLSPNGENKVLIFEPSGALSASFGRQGDGPGEFQYPHDLQVLGDTIAVWEGMFGAVSYFDASGTLLRERHIDVGAVISATRTTDRYPSESMRQPLPDGSFIVTIRLRGWERPRAGELYREPVGYVRVDTTYAAHALGWWEGLEEVSPHDPSIPFLPFPAASIIAGGGHPLSIYLTNGDSYELHRFSTEGVLQRIIRRELDPSPVTSEDVDRWKEHFVLSNPLYNSPNPLVDRRDWEQAMAAVPSRFHPPINKMHVDSEGYLWVQDGGGQDTTAQWTVFDPGGRWLGTLEIPVEKVLWD
ncbi:MAG: 6-bladed beta-propeller [Gemmatimonadota bacterium]|nr:6-bladed beta-propeller [Gemmatimonadota bacterium]MDE2872117.1 6-bladed beta-propeller [Gemmatimonadota bacterium]